ncbi:hypothetical protein JCM14244_05160 [Venenivibrio stagnispumantis]|uniref:Uncharacterized protein n=1 Tax=Venenivibrio stagnispumantis TaxID=407998 RepID=A0AA45WPJ0_9AQUI|nr:hypothetical protein [Venenivibrio stagnispumantis]MCW4572690.1 hypothetical protein [Venenivibrio stagnispumantis]SMP21402.1 hypothetical protein SAMN06264868_1239 [Venenivibrio stagnispumantis]
MQILGLNIGNTIGGCISTNFFLAGIGTVAGMVLISKLLKDAKPVLVGATKEVIAFQQWLSSNIAEGQEFWEDVVAEAKHQYKLEIEKKLEIIQKQQEVLEKLKSKL